MNTQKKKSTTSKNNATTSENNATTSNETPSDKLAREYKERRTQFKNKHNIGKKFQLKIKPKPRELSATREKQIESAYTPQLSKNPYFDKVFQYFQQNNTSHKIDSQKQLVASVANASVRKITNTGIIKPLKLSETTTNMIDREKRKTITAQVSHNIIEAKPLKTSKAVSNKSNHTKIRAQLYGIYSSTPNAKIAPQIRRTQVSGNIAQDGSNIQVQTKKKYYTQSQLIASTSKTFKPVLGNRASKACKSQIATSSIGAIAHSTYSSKASTKKCCIGDKFVKVRKQSKDHITEERTGKIIDKTVLVRRGVGR